MGGTKQRGPEDFRLRETADDDNDVEGHGSRMRGPEGATRSRDTADFTRSRETGGDEDDVEGHGFRTRGGASSKGE